MKEAIGSTYLFQIVITFVLLFTAYLCLSINYARAFRVKDEVVNIIEREKGYTPTAQKYIASYLRTVGYRTTGSCSNVNGSNDYYAYDAEGNELGTNSTGVFCLRKVITESGTEEVPERAYYQLQIFYKLDLPVFGQMFTFKTNGDSYQILHPLDSNTINIDPGNVTQGDDEDGSVGNGGGFSALGEESPYCLNDKIDVPAINGKSAVAFKNTDIFPTKNDALNKTNKLGTIMASDAVFTILGNSNGREDDNLWVISYGGTCGWVNNKYLAIDLNEYLGPLAESHIHNKIKSEYRQNNSHIDGITDNIYYSSSYRPVAIYSFAVKIKKAAINLNSEGYTLVIYDAYRPYGVSQYLSRIITNRNLIASYSAHNVGCAVDVHLKKNGQYVAMQSAVGELSGSASVNRNTAGANKLREKMVVGQGLSPLSSEWWHFSDSGCRSSLDGEHPNIWNAGYN